MFYLLANVLHQIATSEVLPPPKRFWCYLSDLPFGIQNTMASFPLELEHLISQQAPQGAILSVAAGADVPTPCTFFQILFGNGLEYDSDDVDYYSLSYMCFHIDGDNPTDDAAELTLPDQSPRSHTDYTFERWQPACRLGRQTLRPPRQSSSVEGRSLHGSRQCSLPRTMIAQGLSASCASPAWPRTWRPLPDAWRTFLTCQT